mgnify:CR=1 FL=1
MYSENIEGYYDLLVAIVVQAMNDYLWVNRTDKKIPENARLNDEELLYFLRCLFSNEDKVDKIMQEARKLRESGIKSIGGTFL